MPVVECGEEICRREGPLPCQEPALSKQSSRRRRSYAGSWGSRAVRAVGKHLDRPDRHCRSFIALSPFVLVGTADRGGACDVSPCGDRPGFALVLDVKALAIPEPPGNRRLDSLLNVLETGTVGLLFVVPGFEETLRINGRTSVVRDADVLGRLVARDKAPEVVMGVEVGEWLPALRQGVQALGLWREGGWPERSALPSPGRIFRDQGAVPGESAEDLDRRIDESYDRRLY